MKDPLIIAGKSYLSRLLVGTGKYRDFAQTRAAVEASGAEIVTVAIRRTNIGQNANEPSLLDALPPSRFTYLPNTAGCYSAADAVRTLRLARELLDGHDLVKLEVLGDPHTLYPNMPETLKAAGELVKDGFKVMVYCSDDPSQAQMLEQAGCVAIMPLASLIGSGMGILNPWNLQLVMEKVRIPVLVDAGVGTASDAAIAMELGCDGVLMNTAIAAARDPVLMAKAMKKAVEAGREAFLAGRMPKKLYSAAPSSPTEGKIAPKAARSGPSAATSCARAGRLRHSSAPSTSCCRSTASRSPTSRFRRRATSCSRSAPAWGKPRSRSPGRTPASTSSRSRFTAPASAAC